MNEAFYGEEKDTQEPVICGPARGHDLFDDLDQADALIQREGRGHRRPVGLLEVRDNKAVYSAGGPQSGHGGTAIGGVN